MIKSWIKRIADALRGLGELVTEQSPQATAHFSASCKMRELENEHDWYRQHVRERKKGKAARW